MHLQKVGRDYPLKYYGIAPPAEVHSSCFHGQKNKPLICYVSKNNSLKTGSGFFKVLYLDLREAFYETLDLF